MLCMFAMFFKFFSGVSDVCFKCFICHFFMLQVLHLDIAKIDRMLHVRCAWKAGGGTSSPHAGMWRGSPRTGDASVVERHWPTCGCTKTDYSRGHSSKRPDANSSVLQ